MQLCRIEKYKKEQLVVKLVLFPFAFFPESYMVKLLLAGLLTYTGFVWSSRVNSDLRINKTLMVLTAAGTVQDFHLIPF